MTLTRPCRYDIKLPSIGGEAGAATLFDFVGESLHGLARDGAAFAAGEGGVGSIDRGPHLGAGTLVLLPEPNEGLLTVGLS
jgi:hypothetical protein